MGNLGARKGVLRKHVEELFVCIKYALEISFPVGY
jgi:hypothetical protein